MKGLVVLLLLTAAAPAFAQPLPMPEDVTCTSSRVLKRGIVAPCGGILVPRANLDAANAAMLDLRQCKADLTLEQELAKARAEGDSVRLAACERLSTERDGIIDRMIGARGVPLPILRKPWYESAWLWGPAGLVVGGLAGYGVRAITR